MRVDEGERGRGDRGVREMEVRESGRGERGEEKNANII